MSEAGIDGESALSPGSKSNTAVRVWNTHGHGSLILQLLSTLQAMVWSREELLSLFDNNTEVVFVA